MASGPASASHRGARVDWRATLRRALRRSAEIGGAIVLIALLSSLSIGMALRGAFGGDSFVAGAVSLLSNSLVNDLRVQVARRSGRPDGAAFTPRSETRHGRAR